SQQHLPTIIDQIISLRLSNDDNTPQQIERFLSRGFIFCHFIQLQLLSLFSMYSPETMMQMIDDLRHLPNLDHLNSVDCYLGESRLRYSLETLMNLLQNMPNILHLTIETAYIDLNGYRFEPIITNYLPKLKVLQLKMCIALDNITNKEQQIDNLINSCRSSFCLDKHQWFVRCHLDFTSQSNIIWIYTLSYAFSNFNVISDNILIRSTCPQESDFYSYDCVNRFSCKSTIILECMLSHIKFPNIHHLILEYCPNPYFWSIIPTLDQLVSLEIFLCDESNKTIQDQLQNRLCRAPHLTSLKFRSWSILSAFLYEIKNQSIRRLDLQGTDRLYRELWLNGDECIQSGPSTLGIQCEVLFIRVKHRESMLNRVNLMNNIRVLNFFCQDNQLDESDGLSLARHDELVTWFEDQLSLAWEIAKHPRYFRCIQMWIR
ncbi:unnamed protein product, partial [Rotaria magnacalcarata]